MDFRPVSPSLSKHRWCRGFSLMEVLVVMALLALLALLLVPALSQARERSMTAKCLMQMRHWANTIHLYAAEHGAYPPAVMADASAHYWYTTVSGYQKDRQDIYCPEKKGEKSDTITYNMYLGWARANVDSMTQPYKRVSPLMVAQPSKTAMFTDGSASPLSDGTGWAIYRKVRSEYNHAKHNGGANWVFCDGHGEWLSREKALELGGQKGDAFPFVRPFEN